MNKVILLGFLAQDPVAREFPEKNLVTSNFSVAVSDSRNYNVSYFFNCVAWNQTADYVNSSLHKGDFVVVDGRLTNRSYINKAGQKVYVTEVVVETIRNLGSKRAREANAEMSGEEKVNVDDLLSQTKSTPTKPLAISDEDVESAIEDDKSSIVDWDDME